MYRNTLDQSTIEEIRVIRKVLEVNSNPAVTDIAALTSGGALSRQFLDGEMVSIVESDVNFRFLKETPTRSVDQTLAEYTKNLSHGAGRHYGSSFIGQSDNPKLADAQLKRFYDEMCYLSEGGVFSKASTLVKNIQDPEIVQTNAATMRLMRNLAISMWHGNKDTNMFEFNGFKTKIESENPEFVFDCRGNLPTVDVISDFAARISTKWFGTANKIWVSPGTRNLINNTYQSSGNVMVWQNNSQNPGNINLGNIVKAYQVSEAYNGELLICSDIWTSRADMDVPKIPSPTNPQLEIEGATGPDAPHAPTFTVSPLPVTSNSLFDSAYAGNTKYRVAAMAKGESSIAAPASSGTNIIVGGGATITITPAVTGTPAEAFRLYRETKPGSGIFRWFKDIKNNAPLTPTTIYNDLNADIPGTSIGVMGDFNTVSNSDINRTYILSELMPLLKTTYPYGVGGTTVKQQLLALDYFCVLQIFAIEKFVLFKNMPVS